MSGNLSKVWPQVEGMLDDGLSLIPVRDKQKGSFLPKTPFKSWQESQERRMSVSELWQQMETYETEAVAIVCGKVSGNLEIIDIDSKYFEGISIKLFKEIKSLRPDLYAKLRVHKTPSGGYHILYRIADKQPDGNKKLAERKKTEEEITQDKNRGIKNPKKFVAFLETRGEKGYALMPPSMGYTVHINNDIPILSWLDRCEIIQICKSFNENIPVAKTYTKSKSDNNFYEESPWDDYNSRGDAIALLKEYGWKLHRHETAERYYFTRPDKDKGVSASLTRNGIPKFYAFTSSSNLEQEKTYTPIDLLITLQFNGNNKEAYQYLVKEGFGKVKKKYEDQIVKQKAVTRTELPANFSEEARKSFEDLKNTLDENMPFGQFWEYDENGKIIVSREDLYHISHQLGFAVYQDSILVRVNGSVISLQTESQYFNTIKNYIWEEEADIYKDICNSFESFLQKSGKFTISRLNALDESRIMSDNRHMAYKFYQNGFTTITADSINFQDYNHITGLVWEHKVQSRDYNASGKQTGVYLEYLQNAIGITPYLKRVIGNLSIDYKDEASSYIIVLIEKVPDPKLGGGSGKNIFGNILKYTTSIKTVPGSQVKFDENFLQPWNGQRIYFLADLPKRIDWPFLKEMTTGTGIHKRLYKDQVDVDCEDMPKLLLNTNYSFEESDGGLIRRIRQVEFTDYYTVNGGVDEVHGKMFPKDFDQDDWDGFDQFINECIQLSIIHKHKLEKEDLSEIGWVKKFQMQYGESTYQFIDDNMELWQNTGFVSNKSFNDAYLSFSNDLDIPAKFRLSSQRMNQAISEYCSKNNLKFNNNYLKKINSIANRGKMFGDESNFQTDGLPF